MPPYITWRHFVGIQMARSSLDACDYIDHKAMITILQLLRQRYSGRIPFRFGQIPETLPGLGKLSDAIRSYFSER
jgi:hypothetical protein